MDEPWRTYTRWSRLDMAQTSLRPALLTRGTWNKWVLVRTETRGTGTRGGELRIALCNLCSSCFGVREWWWLFNTVNAVNLLCPLKRIQRVSFLSRFSVVVFFFTILKKMGKLRFLHSSPDLRRFGLSPRVWVFKTLLTGWTCLGGFNLMHPQIPKSLLTMPQTSPTVSLNQRCASQSSWTLGKHGPYPSTITSHAGFVHRNACSSQQVPFLLWTVRLLSSGPEFGYMDMFNSWNLRNWLICYTCFLHC